VRPMLQASHKDRPPRARPVGSGIRCSRRLVAAASAAALLALALCVPALAHAAVIQPLTIAEMARASGSIALVRVDSVETRWTSGGTIETVVGLRTMDQLKGTTPTELRVPGGTVDEVTMRLDGTPSFAEGENCLLFLDDHGRVVGGPQGKVLVVGDSVPSEAASLSEVEADIRSAIAGKAEAAPRTRRLRPLSTSDVFVDDFESGATSWTVDNSSTDSDAHWVLSDKRAKSPTHSMYCSAVTSGGAYPDDVFTWMMAGPFDLSAATGATLSFDTWYDTEADSDYMQSWVTTDKANWYLAGDYDGSSGGWVNKTNDLTNVDADHIDFRGESKVYVEFDFFSDGSSAAAHEGAYIDDVVLSTSGGSSGTAPVITGITPGSASAGTGTTITIAGSGFGGAQGTGEVDFTYDSSTPIVAPIVSWTDTRVVCVVPADVIDDFAASAGSGPVTIVNGSGETSNEFPFTVTFAYDGFRWASPSATFRVNANYAGITDELAMVKAAASTWSSATSFEFNYGGTCNTTGFPAWNSHNDVFWTDSLPPGVFSQTVCWWSGSQLMEADLGLSQSVDWGDGTGSSVDVQTVALHEFGHWLALRALYGPNDTAKVMYGNLAAGVIKRTLTADDIAGANWIYRAGGGVPGCTFDSVEGAGRLDTAVQACQRAFPTSGSADTIVLATGYNWPDALGGASLAGAYGGPLLLTRPNVLSSQVLDEARRLNIGRVVILGSGAAVSTAVENSLKAATVNGHKLVVTRVGGAGRYDTAARIASATVDVLASKGRSFDHTAFFATGGNFPDALAASPIAMSKCWPILLVRPDSPGTFTEGVIAKLGITSGYLLGSDRAVTSVVANRLKTVLHATPTRLSGATRYDTGIAIARFGVTQGHHWDGVAIAVGTNFPDALAGGVMQGKLNSVVLLTPGTSLNAAVGAELGAHKGTIATVRYLGSTSALSQSVRNAVAAALH
jgi:putative cell wall-binding protein